MAHIWSLRRVLRLAVALCIVLAVGTCAGAGIYFSRQHLIAEMETP
jgi:hypothetical protein